MPNTSFTEWITHNQATLCSLLQDSSLLQNRLHEHVTAINEQISKMRQEDSEEFRFEMRVAFFPGPDGKRPDQMPENGWTVTEVVPDWPDTGRVSVALSHPQVIVTSHPVFDFDYESVQDLIDDDTRQAAVTEE